MRRKKEVDTIEPEAQREPITATPSPSSGTSERLAEKLEDLKKQREDKLSGPSPFLEGPPDMASFRLVASYVCPLCGQELQGVSRTGAMSEVLQHPWGDNLYDRMRQCQWRGKKFRIPTMMLEVVD